MHELIAAPFLGEYFLLRPGAVNGVKLPRAQYEELASAPVDEGAEGLARIGAIADKLMRRSWRR